MSETVKSVGDKAYRQKINFITIASLKRYQIADEDMGSKGTTTIERLTVIEDSNLSEKYENICRKIKIEMQYEKRYQVQRDLIGDIFRFFDIVTGFGADAPFFCGIQCYAILLK